MQLDGGMITADEARVHPHKNIVLRAVGMEQDFSLDILRGNSYVDDLFLLCSDGLTDMIGDEKINNILSFSAPLTQQVESLVGAAKAAGGRDNITVALCKVK
jgi:protein phosphatase